MSATRTKATPEHLRRLAMNQIGHLLNFHRRMYRACLEHNPSRAEEVRTLVLKQYGIDLATEAPMTSLKDIERQKDLDFNLKAAFTAVVVMAVLVFILVITGH